MINTLAITTKQLDEWEAHYRKAYPENAEYPVIEYELQGYLRAKVEEFLREKEKTNLDWISKFYTENPLPFV